MKKKRPELTEILDELTYQDHAESLIDGKFLPTPRNYFKEIDRIESKIGRYPVGFRHYENYFNYSMKYPDRTIDDY